MVPIHRTGMKADPAGAERTYLLAMRYGDELSAFSLAQLWEIGKVGKPELVTKLYRHAALRMHPPSMIEMAKRLSQQKETLQEALVWASLAEARHVDEAPALMRDIRGKLASAGLKPDKNVFDKVVGEMALAAMETVKLP